MCILGWMLGQKKHISRLTDRIHTRFVNNLIVSLVNFLVSIAMWRLCKRLTLEKPWWWLKNSFLLITTSRLSWCWSFDLFYGSCFPVSLNVQWFGIEFWTLWKFYCKDFASVVYFQRILICVFYFSRMGLASSHFPHGQYFKSVFNF